MKTILLTGARAPATLDLARALHEQGHRVIAAESLAYPLSIHSNAFSKFFEVTAPNTSRTQFIDDIEKIIVDEKVDFLLPTCEEAFHISFGKKRLEEHCEVCVDSEEKLNRLHSKFEFNLWVTQLGFAAPLSFKVKTIETAIDAVKRITSKKVILKPEFSRFASKTLILSHSEAINVIPTLSVGTGVSWVIQECLVGPEFCTYSLAKNGKLISHVTYDHEFTAGRGAGICFQSVRHTAIEAWVKHFVERTQYTGQIAFDFIETSPGIVEPLECNPRATSGLHLIANQTGWIDALLSDPASLDDFIDVIRPKIHAIGQLKLAMLVYGLPSVRSLKRLGLWMKVFFGAREVVFSFQDPRPFFDQFISFYTLVRESKRRNMSALEVSTHDIEWNG